MNWIKYFTYKVKYQQKIANFPKLVDVIMSCETLDQCNTALKYIQLYNNQYTEDSSAFAEVTRTMLKRFVMYLSDTGEHIERGVHQSELNDFEIQNTYPDMNDYINDFIDVKFKKSWQRGVPSVING